MSSATSIRIVRPPAATEQFSFRAMASQVNVRTEGGASQAAFDEVAALFAAVETDCTRFDPASALMRANARGGDWTAVGPHCYAAIEAAAQAHRATAGLFDPRILTALRRLGYDRSFPPPGSTEQLTGELAEPAPFEARWQPGLDQAGHRVRIGADPIDLGGIGKGLAVRWSLPILRRSHRTFLIEAGGDCYLAGTGPAGAGWQVGIEDPAGGTDPVAVVNLIDLACATSSTRLRRWTVAGEQAHHLIDPRTRRPGRGGVAAVTVLAADPAWAEVWSKVLFLAGRDAIADAAAAHALAAVWVGEDGTLANSAAADELICWRAR